MKIYWVQHGDSLPQDIDPEQPLSEKGKKDIVRLAHFLSKRDILVSHLYHSGKLRAKETAELLAPNITSLKGIEIFPGISPMDDVNPVIDKINTWNEDVLLVSHLPFITKCISKLLTGDENKPIVNVERGSLICLEKSDNNQFLIHWMLRPQLFTPYKENGEI